MAAAIPMVGEAVTGIGQKVAAALSHPMLTFRLQPGRYKKHAGKKEFVPNPAFPMGIDFSVPAYVVLIVGLVVLVNAIGGLSKLISGLKPTTPEEQAMESLQGGWGQFNKARDDLIKSMGG